MLIKVILWTILLLGDLVKYTEADLRRLPLIQISHDDLDDDYPEMQEEIHLEDFFWTGSGDGPPDFLKKVHTGISKGKDVIVKTETVVATVYVDGNNEVDIPICLDCLPDDGGGGSKWSIGSLPPLNYSATDRRYWLLTVMSGFYTQKDNPELEAKLARLYRLAFTRQQTKHLGINGNQQIPVTAGRDRRHDYDNQPSTTERVPSLDVELIEVDENKSVQTKRIAAKRPGDTELDSSEELEASNTTIFESSTSSLNTQDMTTDYTAYATVVPWELIQQNAISGKQMSAAVLVRQPPNNPLLRQDYVRVIIHNITQLTEDEVLKGTAGGPYDEDINDKIDERPIANQTELIYTVFVNGRPVLAVTAANDMKLVSDTEVSDVIGNPIFMKAEPYLREPQATPLAPATRSGSVGFIDSIHNNPALVIVSSVAILLLLLLLIALLLMGRSRVRERNAEVNRTSSRNELLSESQSARPNSTGTAVNTGRSTAPSRDVGIQNFSFENENTHSSRGARDAHIHFPGPPTHSPDRRSLTSSDNTSDSSVYCPINPPTTDVQRMLDAKAASLFERHKRRHHQYDRPEGHQGAVYTSVVSEQKRDKARHKTKRRYLSENRVGSLETSPVQRSTVHSSGEEAVTDSADADAFRPSYENFERVEAINPHNNYHRNKLLHQKSIFVDKEYTKVHDEQLPAEAINKEIIRALQPSERSSDTGSIGSYLSMGSVKAFPKQTLPEPLNRVLDPVFVTYYDNVDNSAPKQTSSAKPQRKSSLDATTIATIESFPSPKAPGSRSARPASHSDNPDPGVIGPIVWERHKKQMGEKLETDFMRYGRPDKDFTIQNPAAMRNHYEGLLEGAMQMYGDQDDLPMPLPARNFTNSRKPTKRANRGSSAGLPSSMSKSSSLGGRPATAQSEKIPQSSHSTEPPSPTLGAWGGSVHSSHSPLVRPLSAGPFHRPEPPVSSQTTEVNLTAAPLIEAIQNELRKFKQ